MRLLTEKIFSKLLIKYQMITKWTCEVYAIALNNSFLSMMRIVLIQTFQLTFSRCLNLDIKLQLLEDLQSWFFLVLQDLENLCKGKFCRNHSALFMSLRKNYWEQKQKKMRA